MSKNAEHSANELLVEPGATAREAKGDSPRGRFQNITSKNVTNYFFDAKIT